MPYSISFWLSRLVFGLLVMVKGSMVKGECIEVHECSLRRQLKWLFHQGVNKKGERNLGLPVRNKEDGSKAVA